MPPVSLLIKPASSSCNMRCEYCFYADVASRRHTANYGIMSVENLEQIVKKVLDYADGDASFGFQGGEPTLAGLDFFRVLVELQARHNQNKVNIHNAIQTNGLNLDDDWARFLHAHHFLVGLSLDGSQQIHDKYRKDAVGEGTFERVLAAAKRMDRFRVEYNILSTVNLDVAKNIEKIYYFFKKQGFSYLQFIPCLDELDGEPRAYSLTPEAYGDFLIRLFKLWYVDLNSGHPVSIRYFDNLAMMLAGYPPESCGMAGVCGCYYMVEADGSTYPCDFYVTDEWKIGNILTDGLEEMRSTETARRFQQQSVPVAEDCKTCPHYRLCRGGCRRNREPFTQDVGAKNQLCEGLRAFFDYASDDLLKVARRFLPSG